jgi:hypothetical protein
MAIPPRATLGFQQVTRATKGPSLGTQARDAKKLPKSILEGKTFYTEGRLRETLDNFGPVVVPACGEDFNLSEGFRHHNSSNSEKLLRRQPLFVNHRIRKRQLILSRGKIHGRHIVIDALFWLVLFPLNPLFGFLALLLLT